VPIVKSEEKSVLKYVNTISVKPQNVWMVTHRVISLKNVSQIQIQSSNQTSTFKIITKPTKKESQRTTATIPHCRGWNALDYRTELRGDAWLSHGKWNPCIKASLLIARLIYQRLISAFLSKLQQ